jgi:hypothetical protein
MHFPHWSNVPVPLKHLTVPLGMGIHDLTINLCPEFYRNS